MNVKNSLDTFWERMHHAESGCWEWTGARGGKMKYGVIRIKGRLYKTHRIAYELAYGPIPEGKIVCHRCDNPPCCNPGHLFLGTYTDNVIDCIQKGRALRNAVKGEDSHLSKLTEQVVAVIRQRYAAGGVSQSQLAQEYGVRKSTIGHIVRGDTWAYLLEGNP